MRFIVSSTYPSLVDVINSARSGDHIQITPGTYPVTPNEPVSVAEQPFQGAALHISGQEDIEIQGVGAPVIQAACHGTVLTIQDCHNIRITGITFAGQGYVTEPKDWYFAAINLAGQNNRLLIERCSFYNLGNHGIAHLLSGCTSRSTFRDLVFERGGHLNRPGLGGDGAALAPDGQLNLIENCHIKSWLRGVEIESKYNDHEVRGNTVRGCHIEGCMWHGIIVCPTHGNADLFRDNRIVDCIVSCPTGGQGAWTNPHGIYIQGGRDFSVTGCTVSDLSYTGIHVGELDSDASDFIISGNRVRNVQRTGIHIQQSLAPVHRAVSNGIVTGNMIGPVGGRGIWVDGQNLFVDRNMIHDTGIDPSGKRWEAVYYPPLVHPDDDVMNPSWNTKETS